MGCSTLEPTLDSSTSFEQVNPVAHPAESGNLLPQKSLRISTLKEVSYLWNPISKNDSTIKVRNTYSRNKWSHLILHIMIPWHGQIHESQPVLIQEALVSSPWYVSFVLESPTGQRIAWLFSLWALARDRGQSHRFGLAAHVQGSGTKRQSPMFWTQWLRSCPPHCHHWSQWSRGHWLQENLFVVEREWSSWIEK
jgi:hypothetical protein